MAALVLIGQALGLEDFASVAYTSPIAMAFAVAAWRVILDREERAWVLEKIKFRFGGKAAAE
jgi:hypothetical protein